MARNIMRPPKSGPSLFPNSEQLEVYSKLDPHLPSPLITAIDRQLEREDKYATWGQRMALIRFLSVSVLVARNPDHSTTTTYSQRLS